MYRGSLQLGGIVVAMVLAASVSAFPQRRVAPLPRLGQRPPRAGLQPTPQERKLLDLPPRWTERLQNMTPAQQDKFLNNNARFRNLPAEQQAQIRQRLQTLNKLPPEERRAVIERERVWQQMTPEQQRHVRDTLLPTWRNLAPARRQILLRRLHDLRGLDDAQRAAKLNDDNFTAGLSADERQMLRDLSALRVGDQGPPGEF
jgi:hypothetical protein